MITITRPTLVIDEEKCRRNILKMKLKAEQNNAIFRPHFKTHQSHFIGEWFREVGIKSITVSSVEMAEYFAKHGWNDITIAFPVNLLEIAKINDLAKKKKLILLVESEEIARQLSDLLKHEIGVFIKIDVGAGRTGIPIKNVDEIIALANLFSILPKLSFKGLLTHAGHTYHTSHHSEIEIITTQSIKALNQLKKRFDKDIIISWGDTPSCSIVSPLLDADEWRPGNFVFNDVMQFQIGSCKLQEIAVAMFCPVVAVHPDRNKVIIYGGAVHFSKEFFVDINGNQQFGLVVHRTANGWGDPIEGARFESVSQEHGVIYFPDNQINKIKIADILCILPVHSCLTVSAMKEMLTLNNEVVLCMK